MTSAAGGDAGLEEALKRAILAVPDFPKPGVIFRDITPVLADPDLFARAVSALAAAAPSGVTHVAAVEARGFLFGAPLAAALGVALAPIRKPGKLPRRTIGVEYGLEYGAGELRMHADAMDKNAAAYLIDDLVATGGTLSAAASLIRRVGGAVAKIGCVVELTALKGRARVSDVPFVALSRY